MWIRIGLLGFVLGITSASVHAQAPRVEPPEPKEATPPSTESETAVYSGPQVGEPLPRFAFRQVLGVQTPKDMDPVEIADGKPIVLVFIHDVNRQAIAMARSITRYTAARRRDGLTSAVVLMGDDIYGTEGTLKRIQHALTPDVPSGVSLDGREGPGALGLNRSVQVTVLIANHNMVTANFAMVQPSLQVDLPQVVRAIVDQVGGEIPDMSQLTGNPTMEGPKRGARSSVDSDRIRSLLRPLIQKDATLAEVDQAADAIERAMAEDPAIHAEIHRIATTIVESNKLENYGTAHAQSILKAWAAKPPSKPSP